MADSSNDEPTQNNSEIEASSTQPAEALDKDQIPQDEQPDKDEDKDEQLDEDDELDPATLRLLTIVAVVLGIIAIVLCVRNLSGIGVDITLGNMTQSLVHEGRMAESDIDALAKKGESIIPRLEKDLHGPKINAPLGVAIVTVIGRIPGERAEKALRDCLEHSEPQIRSNAALQLDSRGVLDLSTIVDSLYEKSEGATRAQVVDILASRLRDPAKRYRLLALSLGDADPQVVIRGIIALHQTDNNLFKIPNNAPAASPELRAEFAAALLRWSADGARKESAPAFPPVPPAENAKTGDTSSPPKSPSGS